MVSRASLALIFISTVTLIIAGILITKYNGYTFCPQYQTNLTYTTTTYGDLTAIHSEGLTYWQHGGINYTQIIAGPIRHISTIMLNEEMWSLIKTSCEHELAVARYYFDQSAVCGREDVNVPFCVIDPQSPTKCLTLDTTRTIRQWVIIMIIFGIVSFFGSIAMGLHRNSVNQIAAER